MFTGTKSFVDNPVLGAKALNDLGLHVARVKIAHGMAGFRRRWISRQLSPEVRKEFDRNGYVLIRNFLPTTSFDQLRRQLLALDIEARSQQQGDTITTRVAVGPKLLADVPELKALLASPSWCALLSYVASFTSRPLYYLQNIGAGVADGPPDPQQDLHSDTFHPSMKAWLFLTDVDEEGAPLTYVQGSHRLSKERLAWEKQKSIDVLSTGDRLSQRGSFRISRAELASLGLPPPTSFTVPANTLVVIDTCGFHARGVSAKPSTRTELWAYSRRSPFLPWPGLDPLAWGPLADRRGQWLTAALDWLDERGWAKQHWRPSGSWRDHAAKSRPRAASLKDAA